MDVTDFTKCIITDVDNQDAPVGSMDRCVNFDPFPGKLRKRYGTTQRTFAHYNQYLGVLDVSPVGTGPYADEEIVGIEIVYAPDAKIGSIDEFPSAEEKCFNQNVTFILVKLNGTANTYQLYGDIIEHEKFCRIPVIGNTFTFESWDDDGPYMIPRQSAVAIGNVKNPTLNRADVLWVGHIKKQAFWTRFASGSYGYADTIDEWRSSWAECYDSEGDIEVELLTSIYEKTLRGGTAAYTALDTIFLEPPKTYVKNVFEPWLLHRPASFNIKVTAVYDGYQESRPLRWKSNLFSSNEITDGVTTWGEEKIVVDSKDQFLPTGWSIKRDEKHNQYVRIEANPPDRFCVVEEDAIDFDGATLVDVVYTSGPFGGAGSGPVPPQFRIRCHGDFTGRGTSRDDVLSLSIRLRWNGRYVEDGDIQQNGEGFKIYVHTSKLQTEMGQYGRGFYGWDFDSQGRRTALHLYPGRAGEIDKDTPPKARAMTLETLLWLLGVDYRMPESVERVSSAERTEIELERQIVRSLFTVAEWQTVAGPTFIAGHPGYPAAVTIRGQSITADQIVNAWLQGEAVTDEEFTLEFGLSDRVGAGLLAINPIIPDSYFAFGTSTQAPMSSSFFDDTRLVKGGRRITAFRIYVKEDDVDIDYRMIREVPLNYDETNTKRGGTGELPDDVYDTFRELVGGVDKAPVWMYDDTPSLPQPVFRPFFKPPFDLNGETDFWNLGQLTGDRRNYYLGLGYRGGLNRAFIISSDDLTDREGLSLLSANLLRDEWKVDRPEWKRGNICEGRMFGIKRDSVDIQYSIMAGGVTQYDIMPGLFHVSKNEIPQHIVSWRGRYHIIFTDQNLWRIDLADGDEFSWRILDTYAEHGTTLWRSIVNAPAGLFYASRTGIWVYAGDKPVSLTHTRWEEDFLRNWRPGLTPANSWAAYNPFNETVHFVLDPTSHDRLVWVFHIRYKGFTQYQYDAGKYPRWMGRYENEFYLAFGDGDLRASDNIYWYDGKNYEAYTCWMRTNELPPPSEIDVPFWQYIGQRYYTFNPYHMRYGVAYGPYGDGTTSPLVYSVLSAEQRNDLSPLPFGIGRGIRIIAGQGSYFGDSNSSFEVIYSGFSLRGAAAAKYQGVTDMP